MNDAEWQKIFRRWDREAGRAKIVQPGPEQYVDRCHYSKTGWAVWNKDGGCTCKPAKEPAH